MKPETKREIVILLARAVAHLYAIAGTLASRREWSAAERAAELVRVLEMLKRAYDQLGPLPDCAASVLEQFMVIRSVQESALDDVQAAMALARAGLVINTWCTASTMLVSAQATEGPLTIGGLLQILGTLQPDPRYQAAVAEKLAAVAYDNSAARQLGNCYFQAFEGFSLLELHHLLSMGDTSRAADLLDNASRGALTAVRFLEREPLDQAEDEEAEVAEADDSDGAQASDDAQAQVEADEHAQGKVEEAEAIDGAQAQAEADDSDGAQGQAEADDQAQASDGAQGQAEADDQAQASDGAQVEADDMDGAQADDMDGAQAQAEPDEAEPAAQAQAEPDAPHAQTDEPGHTQRTAAVRPARDPPASTEALPVERVTEEIAGA